MNFHPSFPYLTFDEKYEL